MKAMCLHPESPSHGRYTAGSEGCDHHTTDPGMADFPSERAPNAADRSGRGETLGQIAERTGMSVADQLKAVFGADKVTIISDGAAAIRFVNQAVDKVLPDGRVERQVTRQSMVSGKTRTKKLVATAEQWAALDKGALIQNALPHLSLDDREFILTGITGEEWDDAFPEEDEADEGTPPARP
jgi:hypothetical protein